MTGLTTEVHKEVENGMIEIINSLEFATTSECIHFLFVVLILEIHGTNIGLTTDKNKSKADDINWWFLSKTLRNKTKLRVVPTTNMIGSQMGSTSFLLQT